MSCARALSRQERLKRIEKDGPLSIARQCRLLGLSRKAHYRPAPQTPERDLALMRLIDEKHLAHPVHGSRQMKRALELDGVRVGRRRVRRLMGAVAVAPKPATSAPAPGHKVHPYLLRGMAITEANQAWCADITYIPVRGGFMYLVAVMDWATRFVLSWRLSNCMETGFCLDALHEAPSGRSAPGIFNTDQGSQFTSAAFTGAVEASGARMSMDGRGRWLDNRFIERLWRSMKCEAVYLHDLESGIVAHRFIGDWFLHYNNARPHSALRGITPRMACDGEWKRAA